jgi:hypothetical protein
MFTLLTRSFASSYGSVPKHGKTQRLMPSIDDALG